MGCIDDNLFLLQNLRVICTKQRWQKVLKVHFDQYSMLLKGFEDISSARCKQHFTLDQKISEGIDKADCTDKTDGTLSRDRYTVRKVLADFAICD